MGWYWSGCAGQAKWGLEIGGIAVIDLDNYTAFHLEAVQTLIEDNQVTSLSDWLNQPKQVCKSFSMADIKTIEPQ